MGMQRNYRVLICTGHGLQCLLTEGIDTCLGLPRLTALEQTAPWVLGAFDLRGELVPVVDLGVFSGGPAPLAAITDLVLVVLAGGFPLGLYSARPVRIEPSTSAWPTFAAAHSIDLSQLPLAAPANVAATSAERRLARFERRLTSQALRRLEQRARCYGEFAGSPQLQPVPTPALHG